MTIRTMIQLFLYLVGGGLMAALWRTGTPIEANIGWYVVAGLIVMTGYAPKDSFWLTGALAFLIFGLALCGLSESVFKLGVPVGFFLVGLSGVAHWLDSPAEVNLV